MEYASTLLLVAGLILGLWAVGHAVLTKRDPRSALLWSGLALLSPLVGALLYYLFGINRVQRRAVRKRRRAGGAQTIDRDDDPEPVDLPGEVAHLSSLERFIDRIADRSLVGGNKIAALSNAEEAYPVWLEAIAQAETSVSLATYIFESSPAGRDFVAALEDAVRRGVEVRVLVDGAGAHYGRPRIGRLLRKAKVPHATFNPSLWGIWRRVANLRNHRKICVVDGRVAFAGGMNIQQEHYVTDPGAGQATRDVHFQIEGPVVAQLQETFAEDWRYTAREELSGPSWFPPLEARGNAVSRVLTDGPDDDLDRLRWTLLGAISCAQRSVQVLTPYFLPDLSLISALNAAALRGVAVDIILPEWGQLPFFRWAVMGQMSQVLKHGCRVWFTPRPFDHAKLLVVDSHWTMIGSSNWDARSLRLNFEMDVETYDAEMASRVESLIAARLAQARRVTQRELDARPLPRRLRDGVARLLTPIL